MLSIASNQKGNFGIAIALTLIAVMSGISLASIAFRDSNSYRMQLDAIQEFHFLRSEVGRGRLMVSHFETLVSPPMQTTLPIRTMRVNFGNHRTAYNAKTKLSQYNEQLNEGYLIRSMLSAVRGTGSAVRRDVESPVMRYSENRIKSLQTLAIFHYFSDVDRERDDVPGNIRFFGQDIVHGRVHSNTDIWIRNLGGWPIFYGLVSTAGVIRVYPGGGTNFPRDEVFRGGLIENYRRIVFEPSANLVRRNGSWPFGRNERDNYIAFVTVEGTSYSVMMGEVLRDNSRWREGFNQFTIYDLYPPYGPIGDSIGVNRIARVDTLWRSGQGGSVNNGSVFVPMELWISGNFGGKQSWASSHNIYLKGDLTYERTTPGLSPDGLNEEGNLVNPVNTNDYLGIISERSIFIQYGHRSPIDSMRYRPNTEHIYMYGAYCSVGKGENVWDDGIVSFQYHFPKGSTPSQIWQGNRYKKIDLHRYHFPTTSRFPWPLDLDYPWYNPLWPEPGPGIPNPHGANTIVRLRGNIYLFGSIAQRRRGYVRRSGNADFDTGLWDVENLLNPTTPPQYGAPPPSIGPSGYDKRYTFDTRFENTGPPHFPLVKFEGYETDELMDLGHMTVSWAFKRPPSNF